MELQDPKITDDLKTKATDASDDDLLDVVVELDGESSTPSTAGAMQGIPATDVNYPCGTEELAVAVADLLAREPDPEHAVIGLRNHGITATGETLDEILDRIEPKLVRQVPMS